MIRSITPEDTPALVEVCARAGVFAPEELPTVRKLLDEYHAANAAAGPRAIVRLDGDTPVGVAYLTPKELTDRTWELLMIMVAASHQRSGVGSELLRAAEAELAAAGARLMLVETASVDELEPARRFYRKHGYAEVARVPDYYADGVGKVTFTKALAR